MKAIIIHEFGPPDVLQYETLPDPAPRAGEIRIRIHAATVNRVLDVNLRAGKEGARGPKLPLIPGVDCAGVVDAVGAGVTRWKKGMRVAAAGVMPLDVCGGDDSDYRGPEGIWESRAGRLRRNGRGAGLRRDRAARQADFTRPRW